MEDILYKEESYDIIGAAMDVHRTLGQGFAEEVYQQSLEIEFNRRKIPNFPKAPIEIEYKGIILEKKYIADFFCFDDIIVELKAVSSIAPEHESQIINYLKATNVQLGLLINFGENSLKYKRYVNIR